jgi:hypothetical protein
MQSQIYSGAKLTISMNGEVVAAGFVADYSIDTRYDEIETIDNVFQAELAPSKIRVSLNMRVYRTPDNDPVVTGNAPGSSNLGQTEQKAFTQAPYFRVEIKDSLDKTILFIPKFVLERRSASVSAGDFLIESWSGKGIGFYGPQI